MFSVHSLQEMVVTLSGDGVLVYVCVPVRGGGVGVVFSPEMPIPTSYNLLMASSTHTTTTWHEVTLNKLWLLHGCGQ